MWALPSRDHFSCLDNEPSDDDLECDWFTKTSHPLRVNWSRKISHRICFIATLTQRTILDADIWPHQVVMWDMLWLYLVHRAVDFCGFNKIIKYILRCVFVATAVSGEMCWVPNGTFWEASFSTYGNDCSWARIACLVWFSKKACGSSVEAPLRTATSFGSKWNSVWMCHLSAVEYDHISDFP